MEEAHDQYQLMVMNEKHILMNSHIGLSSYDSWEEQAFVEDAAAAGVHGGCVWPPRSYSCSFCGREFKSAQALGGHMNIHRRDRAKLKQSLNNNETDHHHHHHLHPHINHGPGSVSSPLSPSGVSAFSILQGHGGNAVPDSKAELEIEKNDQTIEEESTFQQSHVETDLSVRSLNSVTRRRRLDDDDDDDDDDGEATVGFKRPKTVVFSSLLPFFLKPCSQQSRPNRPELVVLGPKLSSMHVDDNIDLELRLGDLPKVK